MHRILSFVVVILASGPLYAQSGLELKAGTLGLGLEYRYVMDPHFTLRGGINALNYDSDSVVEGILYNYELQLKSVSALVDFFPGEKGFHLTGGALFNGNEIQAAAVIDTALDIGRNSYTEAELGELSGTTEFTLVAPYLGVGWQQDFGQHWGLSIDVGMIFQGQGDIGLQVNGPLANDPTLLQDLRLEEDSLEDELGLFKLYPVAEIGFNYRF